MGAMSPWHWAIVLVALVLLFGSKRLPDAARGVGRSLRIFKSEIKEMSDDKDTAAASPAAPVPPAQLPAVNVVPPVVAPPAAAYPAASTPATPAATETPGS